MQFRLTWFMGLVGYCCAAADRKPVDEILSFAASEPPLLSIDTRLRLANVLVKSDPKKSLEVARDAASLLGMLPDPDTRGELGVRLTTILLATDPLEAQRFVMTMESRRYRDTKAEAMDLLVRYWRARDEKRARQVLADGIGAGAFRVESLKEVMERLRTADPPAVPALFAILTSVFPQDGATDRECLFLLERASQVVSIDSALAAEAAQRVLRAIDSKTFVEDPDWRFQLRYEEGETTFEKEGARDAIRAQAEGFIHAALGKIKPQEAIAIAAAENLIAYPRHEVLAEEPFFVDLFASAATSERELKRIQGEDPEPIYTELERARAVEDASERAPLLAGIAMRPDATAPQRAQIAAEAISAIADMRWLSGRQVLLESLLADAREHDNRALAARAASSLSGTLAAMCASLKGRKQCIDAYDREANFFLREKIEPAEYGVNDPSLLARILILQIPHMPTEPRA